MKHSILENEIEEHDEEEDDDEERNKKEDNEANPLEVLKQIYWDKTAH